MLPVRNMLFSHGHSKINVAIPIGTTIDQASTKPGGYDLIMDPYYGDDQSKRLSR